MTSLLFDAWRCRSAALFLLVGLVNPAVAQDWPEVFDPGQILTLNLSLDNRDWNTIQGDDTNTVRVPAQFWLDGEEPILISVRRKNDPALNAGSGFSKVGLSLDINDYVQGQTWHGLKKLSLQNGGGGSVLSEGFTWQLVRLAGVAQGFGYSAGYASWVRVVINGVDTGIYVNTEKRDKRFLENRDLYVDGATWLYEVERPTGERVLQVGGPQDSPTVDQLCYSPFDDGSPCPSPDLEVELPQYIEMAGLLTEMAIDALTANGDALLTDGKNFYFADFTYAGAPKRLYVPWDLDSAKFNNPSSRASIYDPSMTSEYTALLQLPSIRAQYSRIYNDLICGPWSEASLIGLLDTIEPVVGPALDADPNVDQSELTFSNLRGWIATRVANVEGQIEGFQPCPSVQLQVNEVMASNATFLEDPVEPGEFPDWFEIYNPALEAVDIGGIYLTDDPLDPTKYAIPAGFSIPGQSHLVFFADDDGTQGPDHTNFKLSGPGEAVAIYDRDGVTELDSVTFGPQVSDVAYARYPDATGPWDFVPVPTPGQPNQPHNPPPTLQGTRHDPQRPTSSEAVSVHTTSQDDSAVASVTLRFETGTSAQTIAMLDDGIPPDEVAGDGTYAATIPAFGDDTVVEYWIEALDDLGGLAVEPLSAPALTHVYVVGYSPPPLVVNEFMADNDNIVEDPDEPLAFEDWLEIYNGGSVPIALDGMYLTDNLLQPRKFPLPAGLVVPPEGHLVLWADGETLQGPDHLGFQLAAIGEQIGLSDVDARGNLPIDALSFGSQEMDVAQGRCPDGIQTIVTLSTATPGTANLGTSGCPTGSSVLFAGIASGGSVLLDAGGILFELQTFAGDTSEEVAALLADAVASDPAILAVGIEASALGARLITTAAVLDVSIDDPTLSVPEPASSLGLIAGCALLRALAHRRGRRSSGRVGSSG